MYIETHKVRDMTTESFAAGNLLKTRERESVNAMTDLIDVPAWTWDNDRPTSNYCRVQVCVCLCFHWRVLCAEHLIALTSQHPNNWQIYYTRNLPLKTKLPRTTSKMATIEDPTESRQSCTLIKHHCKFNDDHANSLDLLLICRLASAYHDFSFLRIYFENNIILTNGTVVRIV